MSKSLPLVVDLDGTLTPTDTLVESVARLIKERPATALLLPFWLMRGRAAFKSAVAERISLSPMSLPYRPTLIEYLNQERNAGRRLILATAAHHSIANAVASHLGIFDQVIASDERRNLKGTEKLDAIRRHVGDDFVYAGDSAADQPIWNASKAAILVNASPAVSTAVRSSRPIEAEFRPGHQTTRTWWRALRVHQWLKNLLLFVPVFADFSFLEVDNIVSILIAFLAFSLAASATYIINDVVDLEDDRRHPTKRRRPIAAGDLSIASALVVSAILLASSVLLALLLSNRFAATLVVYLISTTSYSFLLKKLVLIDVLILSSLYTLRIFAGAVALNIDMSPWLFGFSAFIFLSLALIKRCSELVPVQAEGGEAINGRGYQVSDLVVLWPLGVGTGMCSIVVFGLFINAPTTQDRYSSPELLWLVATGLTYWLSYLWLTTARGEMHDDPVVFAARDVNSVATVALMALVTVCAYALSINW